PDEQNGVDREPVAPQRESVPNGRVERHAKLRTHLAPDIILRYLRQINGRNLGPRFPTQTGVARIRFEPAGNDHVGMRKRKPDRGNDGYFHSCTEGSASAPSPNSAMEKQCSGSSSH